MCAQAAFDCRERLRRLAADLAQRASAAVPPAPEVNAEDGRVGATVEGVFTYLEDTVDPTGFSDKEYLSRIFNYCDCSREVYVLALVYIDRLLQRNMKLVVRPSDVHSILLVSIVVATKWHEEVCEQFPDAHYARVGGMAIDQLRQLEARFVELLGWQLHVSPLEYSAHCVLSSALKTKEPNSSLTSTCTTSLESMPPDSGDEDAGAWSDESDDEGCLPGKPLWSAQSYKAEQVGVSMPSANFFKRNSFGCLQSHWQAVGTTGDKPNQSDEEDAPSRRSIRVSHRNQPAPTWCSSSRPDELGKSDDASSSGSQFGGWHHYRSEQMLQAFEVAESDGEDCLPGMSLWGSSSYIKTHDALP